MDKKSVHVNHRDEFDQHVVEAVDIALKAELNRYSYTIAWRNDGSLDFSRDRYTVSCPTLFERYLKNYTILIERLATSKSFSQRFIGKGGLNTLWSMHVVGVDPGAVARVLDAIRRAMYDEIASNVKKMKDNFRVFLVDPLKGRLSTKIYPKLYRVFVKLLCRWQGTHLVKCFPQYFLLSAK